MPYECSAVRDGSLWLTSWPSPGASFRQQFVLVRRWSTIVMVSATMSMSSGLVVAGLDQSHWGFSRSGIAAPHANEHPDQRSRAPEV